MGNRDDDRRLNVFERYLSLWVALCMIVGIAIGKLLPGGIDSLRRMEFGGGSQINIPIAVLIWLMIYPMMLKVDFASVLGVGKRPKGPDHHVLRQLADQTVQHGPARLRFLQALVSAVDRR